MSTVDTSTWSPDIDENASIEGIPLNSSASIAQTWKVIAILMAAMKGDTDAIKAMISVMEGATATADGASGLVPQPLAGDQDKFLKGDGTWGNVGVSSVSGLQTALDAKADDSEVVHKSGAETISGAKTHSAAIEISGVRNDGFSCKYGSHTIKMMVGNSGVNRGIWDTTLSKWVIYADDSESYFNGTVNTSSDERLKTSISAVPDAVLDAWGDVQWKQFQYRAEAAENAPLHEGVVAQQVLQAFASHGLDAEDFGLIGRSATEDGTADMWTIRYLEALSIEAAYQRRRADRLEARIAELEERLDG